MAALNRPSGETSGIDFSTSLSVGEKRVDDKRDPHSNTLLSGSFTLATRSSDRGVRSLLFHYAVRPFQIGFEVQDDCVWRQRPALASWRVPSFSSPLIVGSPDLCGNVQL